MLRRSLLAGLGRSHRLRAFRLRELHETIDRIVVVRLHELETDASAPSKRCGHSRRRLASVRIDDEIARVRVDLDELLEEPVRLLGLVLRVLDGVVELPALIRLSLA